MRLRPLLLALVLIPAIPATSRADAAWLAGDFHIHTCYSHDAYCGPDDDNTGPEDAYTLSGSISERFAEAAGRGLDFLAITDHNDVRSSSDPDFGSSGVTGVPAYEASLGGHAQMLGALRLYDRGDSSVAAIQALADQLRADGGVFQINHPTSALLDRLDDCTETEGLDWDKGYEIVPDSIEVWNIGPHVWQPPLPASNSNDDAEAFWECFLQAGFHVTATGGSDSHWLSTAAAQGPGNPTTWVLSESNTTAGILEAVRAGRTAIGMLPPNEGGTPLLLEADADRDGDYESMQGDTVPPGTPMRVRTLAPTTAGFVQVRANGADLVTDALLVPGQSVSFVAPNATGWVRARLVQIDHHGAVDCTVLVATTLCRNRTIVAGLTSAIWLA